MTFGSDEQRELAGRDTLRADLYPRLERLADGSVQRDLPVQVALARSNDEQALAR